MGDINHPEIDWYQKRSPPNPNRTSIIFMEAIRDAFLPQYVVEAIHYLGNQRQIILILFLKDRKKKKASAIIGTTRKIEYHPFKINFQMLQA